MRRLVAVNALLLAHLPVERLVVGLRLLLRVLAVGHALQLRLRQRAAEEAGRDRARRSLDVSVLRMRRGAKASVAASQRAGARRGQGRRSAARRVAQAQLGENPGTLARGVVGDPRKAS